LVVVAGTNDIKKGKALNHDALEKNELILKTILATSPRSKVLCSALSYRTDAMDAAVDESNNSLKGIIDNLKRAREVEERLFWSPLFEPFDKTDHLMDHVQFTEEGYKRWDEVLFPEIQNLLDHWPKEK
jgi:lysophospholipase L1-like esterase